MRLIDADALKALFDKRYDSAFMQMHTRDNKKYWNGVCTGINWGRNTIADAFTINPDDLRPQGWWLPTNDNDKKRCSRCDVIHLIAQYPHGQANYCPNCGAKMDVEREDTKQ